ncbi:MAG: hypothetical protein ACM3PY_02180, partial [Omnitrophica WOR_2 bacterium]
IMAELSLSEDRDFKLLKEVHTSYPEIPVIILSGDQFQLDEEMAKELGICCYLTKPIDPADILHSVLETLGI